MIFSWWHKNIFTAIFLLFAFTLTLGPTCHRITHQIFTYLILSLLPLAPLFPTHIAFILALEDSRKWMEERAPEWRADGVNRPHQQAGWQPPWALFKQPPSARFLTHSPAQKTTPLSLSSAALRERKFRKRVEKKPKGNLALNFTWKS
jgi:hypothetical protein